MCCSLLYPVLAARLLALYRLVEFNDLVMLEEDLRLSRDAARPWQMARTLTLTLALARTPTPTPTPTLILTLTATPTLTSTLTPTPTVSRGSPAQGDLAPGPRLHALDLAARDQGELAPDAALSGGRLALQAPARGALATEPRARR